MIGLLLFLFCKIHSLRKNCEKSVISKQLMMKKRLLSVALLMGAWGTYGQVGIGTLTPDNSSQLDVVANDKGILIPRISLTSTTDATTIKNGNVNSLLVFNTNTQNDITPGYYYWYVDKWMRIINHDDVTALDANTTNVSLTVVGDELVLTDSEDNVVSIPLSEINIPTTVVKNPDGTYTYTNEAGDTVTIDATDNVISNFENIVNNTNVLNELIEVLGDTYVGGNVYYDGTQFTYIDQTGDTHIVNIHDTLQINEILTTIVKNTDGTYTYTNEAGDTVTIDATDNVISNFENIVNNTNVLNELIEVLGDTYVGGNVYYDGTQFTYIDQAGDTHIVNIQDIVQANETVTTIVKNTDGTYTYTNEAGDTVTIDATDNVISNFENIVNNTNVLNELIEVLGDTYVGGNVYYDGTQFTYIDQAGDTNTINLQEIITNKVVNNIVNQGDIYDEIINILEQESDVLIDNNDGTYTHTAVDGSVVTIDANTTTVEVADGVYTFKDGAGNTITTIDTNAEAIAYNNDNSGLTAENVQDAIDELADKLAEGAGVELKDEGDGKITLIADNGDILGTVDKAALTEDLNNDGLFTFTRNDGQDVVFDVNSVNVSEKLDADGNVIGYDFNDANGNPITTVFTDATNNYYNNDNSGLTAENVQDAIDELADKLAEGAGVELKDEGDGKITLIADNGDILGTVDKAALTEDLNNDGLFTFTRNDGQDVVFDVNSVNVSEKLDADGNVIGYDFNDAAGNPITTVLTDAINNDYNNDNSGLTAENVQDAIDELADKLAEGAGVELKDEGDGTITLIADNGDILGTVDKAALTEDLNNDGLFTFTRNDGQDVVFDVNSVNVSEKLDADGNVIGYDFNDANGNPITTVFTDATNNYYNNDNSGLTAENVQDAIDELADKLAEGAGVELKDEGDGKITLIADNGDILGTVDKAALTEDLNNDGLFTFTRNDGQDVVFDVNSVNVSEKLDADGNVIGYDFNDAQGNVITTVFTDASNNYYNNDNSGLTAENVQDAIDELADKLDEGAGVELKDEGDGKITLIADNGDILGTVDKAALTEDLNNDGLFTFTRNDGQDVVFDVNSVNVSEKLDADGNVIGYDFNDANGNPITTVLTDATNNYYNNDNSGLTAENVQDAIDELADKLAEGAGVELKDEGDGKITLIADNGDILGTVDKAALTEDLNNDGLFTFTRNDGQDVVFDVNS